MTYNQSSPAYTRGGVVIGMFVVCATNANLLISPGKAEIIF